MTLPVWGCPWHGLVQDGQLTLPNGQVMDWWQPQTVPPDPELSGYTFAQRLGTAPAIERSADELAEDAAAGRQWRDSFIVSGTGAVAAIHGKVTAGWIYLDSQGGRWRVETLGEYSWTQGGSLTLPITMRRFGDFRQPAAVHSYNIIITTANLGQSTPTLTGLTSHRARVEDVTADGRSFILMLYTQGIKAWPLGFVRIRLEVVPGQTSLTFFRTILYNRTATLGARVGVDGVGAHSLRQDAARGPVVVDQAATPLPACGALVERMDVVVNEAATPSGLLGTDTRSLHGRVLAVLFDASGDPEPITLDVDVDYHIDRAPQKVTAFAGSHVRRTNYFNNVTVCSVVSQELIGTASYREETIGSSQRTITYTLFYGAHSASVTEYEEHETSASEEWEGQNWSSFQNRTDRRALLHTRYIRRELDGVVTFEQDTSSTDGGLVPIPPYNPVTFDQLGRPAGSQHNFAMQRLCNRVLAMRVDPPGGFRKLRPISPSGVLPDVVGSVSGDPTFTSYNPVTGETALAAVTPVNWT